MHNQSTKASLRRDLKALRAKVKNKRALEIKLTRQVIEWLKKRNFSSVFSYLSTEEETSTYPIVEHLLHQEGRLVTCPKIIDRTTMIAVEFSSLDELETGAHDISTARSSIPASSPIEIALVPGLGFSAQGARLGYGAGYYDRWFEQNPNTLKVALCFECQILPAVPTETHDVYMDFIITEQLVRECAKSG